MKCPKCGSKYVSKHWFYSNPDSTDLMYCQSCNHEWDSKAKEKYQARLDKILAKFEPIKSPFNRGRKYIRNGLVIFYNNEFKTFSMFREKNILKLDTVELLIRDMEANNETN